MKKIIPILIFAIIATAIITTPSHVTAGTLRQAYAALAALQQSAANTANQKQLTDAQIAQTKADITTIYADITTMTNQVVSLQNEIASLKVNIDDKNQEIKQLSSYLQVSSGESAYLEYAFGSETLSEFVYRVAVVQELSDYNSKLITEMKANVATNEEKTKELAVKQQELNDKEKEYMTKLEALGEVKAELEDTYSSITDDIAEAKALLSYYEAAGCKMDDDLDKCAGSLPYNTSVKKPVDHGTITSGFGFRGRPTEGATTYHYGIDIGESIGTRVYPVANGIVTSIAGANNKATAGGLTITIIYNIGGKYYSSLYEHLSSVATSVGKVVSVDTVVAYSGNSGYATTGAHLHFSMTYKARYVSGGLYGIPTSQVYSSYDSFKANAFDQSSMFKLGAVGSYFSSR